MQFSTTLLALLSLAVASVAAETTCAACPAPQNPDDMSYGLQNVCYMGVPDSATKPTDKAFTVCTYTCPDGAVKQCEYDESGALIADQSSSNGFCANTADVTSTDCPACSS
ncbi:hypothetical protein BDN67DRAFT_1003111 [Paxillus ammoniavirescens]|nr:hypothetical protein BDN67DRAFT_1003111 [Paxillus ammoniavirescens]